MLSDALRAAFSGARVGEAVSSAVLGALDAGSLHMLMRKHDTPVRTFAVVTHTLDGRMVPRQRRAQANAPQYYAVQLQRTLGQALAGTIVVEYPTLLLLWQDEELQRHSLAPAPAQPTPGVALEKT